VEPIRAWLADASTSAIRPDQRGSSRAMRLLPGSQRTRPGRDLGPTDPGALGEEPPSLLLHGHASKPRLEPQAVGHPVVEVSDQHARHEPILVGRHDIVK
jgi:hypothetical protein